MLNKINIIRNNFWIKFNKLKIVRKCKEWDIYIIESLLNFFKKINYHTTSFAEKINNYRLIKNYNQLYTFVIKSILNFFIKFNKSKWIVKFKELFFIIFFNNLGFKTKFYLINSTFVLLIAKLLNIIYELEPIYMIKDNDIQLFSTDFINFTFECLQPSASIHVPFFLLGKFILIIFSTPIFWNIWILLESVQIIGADINKSLKVLFDLDPILNIKMIFFTDINFNSLIGGESFIFNTQLKQNYSAALPSHLLSEISSTFLVINGESPLNYLFLQGGILIVGGIFLLISTILGLLFSTFLGLYGVFILSVTSLFFFWIVSIIVYLLNFKTAFAFKFNLGSWFYILDDFKVNFDLYIDNLSLSYIVLTLTISIFVMVYSFSYFRYEPIVERLMSFLNLFIISMVLFVSSSNLIVLFLGWELIGVTSFVLINFWVTKKSTLKAAFKAFSFNKVSDVCFLVFIIIIYMHLYDLNITNIILKASLLKDYSLEILGLNISMLEFSIFFLFSAASIKSAQFLTHIWLPDSMEAPVPASALIHSATLVSAGVYLVLRFSTLFENTSYAINIIPILGGITAVYGGVVASFQSDVKRILAYSTISHCGFLMVSCLTCVQDFTLFYLYVHGFFKAGVFLCVGNVIRFNKGNQDFRKMGGFFKYMPYECYLTLLGLFNLGGFPFSLGFFMKHTFLVGNSSPIYSLILSGFTSLLCLVAALTGIFYSFRLFYFVFFDFKKGRPAIYKSSNRKKIINSQHFSNTSLASTLSIFGLYFTAYIICYILYWRLKHCEFMNFDNTTLISSYFNDLVFNNNAFLWNVSFINWFIIVLSLATLFSIWRRNNLYENTYLTFHNLVLLLFFFFLFYKILL